MKHFKGNPKTHKETDTPTQDNLSQGYLYTHWGQSERMAQANTMARR